MSQIVRPTAEDSDEHGKCQDNLELIEYLSTQVYTSSSPLRS
jgi:hypothetical protein